MSDPDSPTRPFGTNPFGGFVYLDTTGKVKKASIDVTGTFNKKTTTKTVTFNDVRKNTQYDSPEGDWEGWTDVVTIDASITPNDTHKGANTPGSDSASTDHHFSKADVHTNFIDGGKPDKGVETVVSGTQKANS